MIIIRITENVRQLGNKHFNIFVVGNNEGAIVECAVTGAVYSFRQQWEQWANPPQIRYLLLSHAHFDHVCGLSALRTMYPSAQVCSSAEAQRVLGKAKIVNNFFGQDEKMSEVLAIEGIIPAGITSPPVDTIAVDRIIKDGEQIHIEGHTYLQVIDALGHSPCGLAYYLRQDQVMFLSDAGGFQISDHSIFPIFFQDYRLYLETLHRLRGYPTKVLAVPHERIWVNNDVDAFYDRAINEAQRAFRNIEAMLDRGLSDKDIKANLFSEYYRGNLRIYTPENIQTCVSLLLRRVKECL